MLRWVLLAALVLGWAHAATIELGNLAEPLNVQDRAELLAGATQNLAFSDLVRSSANFRPLRDAPIDLSNHDRWMRLQFHNSLNQPGRWLLDLGVPDTSQLEAYRVAAQGSHAVLSLSPNSPFAARPVPTRMLVVPIELAGGETASFYLHYVVHGGTPLQPVLYTPERFVRRLVDTNLSNGILIGVMAALLMFAIVQYMGLRHTAYLYYALMLVFVVLFDLQIEGYNFEWLWPALGRWNQYAPGVLVMSVHLAHIAFTIKLFDLRHNTPWLYQCYLGFAGLMVTAIAIFVLFDNLLPAAVISILFIPLPLICGFRAVQNRLPAASFYLAGAVSVAVFLNVLFNLSVLGILQIPGVNLFVYPKLGYLFEAILFAAAIGQQIRLLHLRHESALQHRLAEAEQLAQAEAERSRALESAQHLQLQLAAAGHDLSQPLSSIRFALAMLRAQTGSESVTRHIDKALDYTESLLGSLIDDAKAGYVAHLGEIEIGELLRDAKERHQAAADAKGLQIRCFDTMATLHGSQRILARIVDNLLTNALRYTDKGGVLLGVRRRRAGLEIQVLDTGHGIDRARLGQIMAPFRQSGMLPAERLGHGLGLHIVHALCEESGYKLVVNSTRGRGSSFGILVPNQASRGELELGGR
jgi:signal transduction histidine kinase